jgi:hypothetical protein
MRRYLGFFAGFPLVFAIGAGGGARAQVSQADLRALTERTVEDKSVRTTPPLIEPKGPTLTYNLGGLVPWQDLGGQSLRIPLEEQYRVTGIRIHRRSPQERERWEPALRAVEAEIQGMLEDIGTVPTLDPETERKVAARRARIDAVLHGALDEMARSSGRQGTLLVAEAAQPIPPMEVSLDADPSDGAISGIFAGPWELYRLQVEKGIKCVKAPDWVAMPRLKPEMIGYTYYFKARWPDDESKPQKWTVEAGGFVLRRNVGIVRRP